MKRSKQQKDAQRLRDLWSGFQASRVVLTANSLGVFELLASPQTAGELARMMSSDTRATEVLLDALASLGLLRKSAATYRNAPIARRYLLRGSRFYQGDMLRHADHLWKSWSGLDEVVRTGKPNRTAGRDYGVFIRAMHNNSVMRAREIVHAINLRGVKTALDMGGGPGTYSKELAKKKISVTLFDLPEAIEIAKDIVGQPEGANVQFISGDFHTDDIGSGYDLVFISQVFHAYAAGSNIALLRKVHKALNPKGTIAVHEFALDENRASPVSGALFSINMLVNTESGRSYSPREMKTWLAETGFARFKEKRFTNTMLLTATKT
jgi:2-polyprenyl-3-methyl-5-hydroxy-6-metoxy-1,4-benzoquinol methylase